jgi:hypothetical protein
MGKKKEIVDNASVIEVIVVEDKENYSLSNGLVDLNRDILMKLIKIIGKDERKIRNIVGMAYVFYVWRKCRNFRWARFPSLFFFFNLFISCES